MILIRYRVLLTLVIAIAAPAGVHASQECDDVFDAKLGEGEELIDAFEWDSLITHAQSLKTQLGCIERAIDPELAARTHWVIGVAALAAATDPLPDDPPHVQALAAMSAVWPSTELPFWAHEQHPLAIAFEAAPTGRGAYAENRDEEAAHLAGSGCEVRYDGQATTRPLARATVAQCVDPETQAVAWTQYLFAGDPLPTFEVEDSAPQTEGSEAQPLATTDALSRTPVPLRTRLADQRKPLLWGAGGAAVVAAGLGLGSTLSQGCAANSADETCSNATKTGLAAAAAGFAGLSTITIGLVIAGEW